MDFGLTASIVASFFSPYFAKAGEKFAEKIGEEIYPKIKSLFIKEDEKEIVNAINENPSPKVLNTFELVLKNKFEENPDFASWILQELNIDNLKASEVSQLIKTIKKIQENIETYNEMLESSGIGTSGDIQVVLSNEKLKLSRLYLQLQKILK